MDNGGRKRWVHPANAGCDPVREDWRYCSVCGVAAQGYHEDGLNVPLRSLQYMQAQRLSEGLKAFLRRGGLVKGDGTLSTRIPPLMGELLEALNKVRR